MQKMNDPFLSPYIQAQLRMNAVAKLTLQTWPVVAPDRIDDKNDTVDILKRSAHVFVLAAQMFLNCFRRVAKFNFYHKGISVLRCDENIGVGLRLLQVIFPHNLHSVGRDTWLFAVCKTADLA